MEPRMLAVAKHVSHPLLAGSQVPDGVACLSAELGEAEFTSGAYTWDKVHIYYQAA